MKEAEQKTLGRNEDLIILARAVRTRGLKGEIVADLLTDFPDRFDRTPVLFALSPDGGQKTVKLEDHWFQKGRIVLKISGYDSIEAASALVGCEFAVPEAERVTLDDDQYYDWELEGCRVETIAGQQVGTVRSVLRTGGVDLLVVENQEKQTSLIPMVSSILIEIDKVKKTILIDPLQGLLDL